MIKRIAPLIILFTFICSASFAGLTPEQRVNDAQMIVDLFEHRYGPMPWKEEFLGIDPAAMAENFLAHAETSQNDEDFYSSIAFYLAGLADVHVQLTIPSTGTAWLGFDTDDIDGDVIITFIDRYELPQNVFPFEVGDRVVSMDGFPVDDLRQELLLYRTVGMPRSDARTSAQALTWRKQDTYPIMPSGISSLTIAPRNGTIEQTVDLPWIQSGFALAPVTTHFGSAKAVQVSRPKTFLEHIRIIEPTFYQQRNARIGKDGEPFFDPWPSFKTIENSPVVAGTFRMDKKKIGYIRFDSFWVSYSQVLSTLSFLQDQIPAFQRDTDALVIDITDNGGGDICYGEEIASFFLRKPIEGVKLRARPTRIWTTEIESIIDLDGVQNERAILEDIHGKVKVALAAGHRLTDPFRICQPFENLPPASTTYTKPILVLVNEFCASTADAFPALLQDAGVAKIFGWRTRGAGGNVRPVGPFGNSDIRISITESLMWREKPVDLGEGRTTNYIENVGVVPDYPYDVTLDDFLNGYKGYRAAIETALRDMLKR